GGRVVDEKVDRPAERVDVLGNDWGPIARVAQVGLDADRRRARRGGESGGLDQAPGQRSTRLGGPRHQRHRRALGGEPSGDAGPDPPAGAGDQRPAPLEPTGTTGAHRSQTPRERTRDQSGSRFSMNAVAASTTSPPVEARIWVRFSRWIADSIDD